MPGAFTLPDYGNSNAYLPGPWNDEYRAMGYGTLAPTPMAPSSSSSFDFGELKTLLNNPGFMKGAESFVSGLGGMLFPKNGPPAPGIPTFDSLSYGPGMKNTVKELSQLLAESRAAMPDPADLALARSLASREAQRRGIEGPMAVNLVNTGEGQVISAHQKQKYDRVKEILAARAELMNRINAYEAAQRERDSQLAYQAALEREAQEQMIQRLMIGGAFSLIGGATGVPLLGAVGTGLGQAIPTLASQRPY